MKEAQAISQEGTEVIQIDQEITEAFKINLIEVQEMVREYQTLDLIPGDRKGYAVCRTALTSCVRTRTGIDKKRLELNADDQKRIKARNGAAKQLAALISPAEEHLSGLVKGEDDRKEVIQAEKRRVEQERVDGIRNKIVGFKEMAFGLIGLDADQLWKLKDGIEAVALGITREEYQEFYSEALRELEQVLSATEQALEARIKADDEAAAQKAEADRLAKQKKEQEETQSKIDKERKEIEEEKAKIAEDKQAEIGRKEEEEREKKEAEEGKVQKGKDAEDKIEREEREAERQRWLRPNKEKMLEFVDHLENDLEWPMLNEVDARALMEGINTSIHLLARTFKEEVEAL